MTAAALTQEAPQHLLVGHAAAVRFRSMVEEHLGFVGRCLRRLGVMDAGVEDAAQQVFLVANNKLASIEPGKERAFLFATATRVASDLRRSARRRPDVPEESSDHRPAADATAEELLDQKRARELLDEVLEAMAPELREVFVLFELEEMTVDETAQVLNVPRGTISSRLTRAREVFHDRIRRRTAQMSGRRAP